MNDDAHGLSWYLQPVRLGLGRRLAIAPVIAYLSVTGLSRLIQSDDFTNQAFAIVLVLLAVGLLVPVRAFVHVTLILFGISAATLPFRCLHVISIAAPLVDQG